MKSRLDGRLFEQFVLDVNIAADDPRPVDRITLRPLLHFAGFSSPTISAVPIDSISEVTVKTHVGNILSKLNLRNRVHAVIFAYEAGMVG